MRIGLCQITSTVDPEANLELVAESVASAAARGARVVLLPEATMACFGIPLGPVAQPLDGPWASAVRAVAEAHDVVVVVGMFTPHQDGRVRNTLLITGRGHHVGYDKIYLFDAFGFAESATVAPGSRPVVFEVEGIVLGVATCYDVRFPELFQELADHGAAAMLVAASWGAGPGKRDQWELLVRARALDSTSWVLACGQADPGVPNRSNAPTGIGFSTVADPYGTVTAQLDATPAVIVVDIDTATVAAARRAIPVLANRRR